MRALAFVPLVAAAFAACVPKHRASSTAPLGPAAESFVDDGPFRLVGRGPEGETERPRELTLSFSRPVHAIGVIADERAPASVFRESDGAAIAGVWHWFGDRTAVFWPNGGFANATGYRVEIDRGHRALDGSTLGATPSFSFQGARPTLTETLYSYDREKKVHRVTLGFNQPIAPSEVLRSVRIVGGRAKSEVPYRVVSTRDASTIEIDVAPSIAGLEDVTVVALPTLTGTEGPLPSAKETRRAVPDVGPLRVAIVCGDLDQDESAKFDSRLVKRCSATTGSIQLSFSKDVTGASLRRSLVLPSARPDAEPIEMDTLHSLDLDSRLEIRPGRKYRIVVKSGLTAADGERVARDSVVEFETADHDKALTWHDVGREIVTESARTEISFPVTAMNLSSVETVSAPLDEASLFEALFDNALDASRVRGLPRSTSSRLNLAAARNAGRNARIILPASTRPAGTSGMFAIATHAEGMDDEVHVASVTDLGVTTKWSPHGGLVWVTRLSSGRPVADVEIALHRVWRSTPTTPKPSTSEVYRTKTDGDGVALVPAQVTATFVSARASDRGEEEAVLLVRHGDDRTYARLPRLDDHLARAIGDVFAERSLYRPGEHVLVKGYFRAPSAAGLVTLPARPVVVEMVDREDRVLLSEKITLDAFGSFSADLPIPRTAKLGSAHVRARVGTTSVAPSRSSRRGGAEWASSASFTIEEYRAVEFAVTARADRAAYLRNAVTRLTVEGKYLLGASMHDVPVTIHATRTPTSFAPPSLEGFQTNTRVLGRGAEHTSDVARLTAKLGADGTATVPITLDLPGQDGPEAVMFDATVEDITRAFAIGDHVNVVVHPADTYLGIAAPFRVEGPTADVTIAAASVSGERRVGIETHVELLRWDDKKETFVPTAISCDTRTTAEIAHCTFAVPARGRYAVHATAKDTVGRSIGAATTMNVASTEPKPTRPAAPPSLPTSPVLTFEQECARPDLEPPAIVTEPRAQTYHVGEFARACVRTKGPTLLTFEREGVLRHELRGPSVHGEILDLPMTPSLYPNFLIGVAESRGRGAPIPTKLGVGDAGHPRLLRRDADFRVEAPAKHLRVKIEIDSEYRPGAELEARLVVRDGADRPAPAQITFWAVDQGVLTLVPYDAPQPIFTFAEGRRSDVRDADSRDLLFWERSLPSAHRTKAPSVRMGATSVAGRDHIGRSVFRPTAWFLPAIVTDASGVAKVKVKLPDNVTTWSVFAVAATADDGFGTGDAWFRTNKPVMVRSEAPRFFRTGDRADATFIVDSLEKESVTLDVAFRAAGALSGAGATKIDVPPDGHVPVRFPVHAGGPGKGSITVRVETPPSTKADAKLADEITLEAQVIAPSIRETAIASGTTRGRLSIPFAALSRARPDVGDLTFHVSTGPMAGLAESLSGLVEYPYGCTEQLTSRLVPLLRLRSLARDLQIALPDDVDGAVRSSLSSLLTHQRSDGGFGFWPDSTASEPWLTILALSTLHTAHDRGFAVPAASTGAATRYLEELDHATGAKRLDPASRVMLEDLFAAMGRPRERELRELAGASSDLPLFARAQLARALTKVDHDLGRRILEGVVAHARRSSGMAIIDDEPSIDARAHLSSSERTTALTLRAFVALDHGHPMVADLARGLLSMRRAGRWQTTRATAEALVALDEARPLLAPRGSPSTARIFFDHRPMALGVFSGSPRGESVSGTIPMSRLVASPNATLDIEGDGALLYYEANLHYARVDEGTPVNQGIQIAKTMRAFRYGGEPAVVRDLRVGDYVELDAVLTTPVARDLVVLDDPIPAGFEAVNHSFVSADRQAARPDPAASLVTHRELRDDRVVTFFDRLPAGVVHTTYVLRVVAPGRFVLPPARVECMYSPDVFGRTSGAIVETRL